MLFFACQSFEGRKKIGRNATCRCADLRYYDLPSAEKYRKLLLPHKISDFRQVIRRKYPCEHLITHMVVERHQFVDLEHSWIVSSSVNLASVQANERTCNAFFELTVAIATWNVQNIACKVIYLSARVFRSCRGSGFVECVAARDQS